MCIPFFNQVQILDIRALLWSNCKTLYEGLQCKQKGGWEQMLLQEKMQTMRERIRELQVEVYFLLCRPQFSQSTWSNSIKVTSTLTVTLTQQTLEAIVVISVEEMSQEASDKKKREEKIKKRKERRRKSQGLQKRKERRRKSQGLQKRKGRRRKKSRTPNYKTFGVNLRIRSLISITLQNPKPKIIPSLHQFDWKNSLL